MLQNHVYLTFFDICVKNEIIGTENRELIRIMNRLEISMAFVDFIYIYIYICYEILCMFNLLCYLISSEYNSCYSIHCLVV